MTEQLQPQHQLAATKLCETRSQMLKDVYAAVVNDDDKSLKAVQKLPINTYHCREGRLLCTGGMPPSPPATNVRGIAGLHHPLPLRSCPAFSPAYMYKLGLHLRRARSFCSLLSFSMHRGFGRSPFSVALSAPFQCPLSTQVTHSLSRVHARVVEDSCR